MERMKNKIAICIPTKNDKESSIRIGYTLMSLVLQTFKDFKVYVRDEGRIEMFADRNVRFIWNLMALVGIDNEYRRVKERKGIGYARKDLIEPVSREEYIMFLDDDMIISPNGVEILLCEIEKNSKIGFVQGTKFELDPDRKYWKDINKVNLMTKKGRIWFGDAAFLLIRSKALKDVDWSIVTKYQLEGLAGEDIAITVMIADKYECWGIPDAIGWHLSPKKTRWIWEAPSDLLQLNLLKKKVKKETLKKALPHLRKYV